MIGSQSYGQSDPTIGGIPKTVEERLPRAEYLRQTCEQVAHAVLRLEATVKMFIGDPPDPPIPATAARTNIPLASLLDTTPDHLLDLGNRIDQANDILQARLG